MKISNDFSLVHLMQFLRRLHVFVGIFIGPFIFIAAFTGLLYGVSFAIEDSYYKNVLFIENTGVPNKLSSQIEKAQSMVGPADKLIAVRPAAEVNESTRVLFTSDSLKESEYRTIFINPITLAVTGDLTTYGSTGAMPMRRTIDLLHRDLLLGDYGRWYSELAASWMWITAMTGVFLYCKRKIKNENNHYQKLLTKHTSLGIFSLIGLIMLSVTGLTWSNYAGDNISKLRTAMDWRTPSVNRNLTTDRSEFNPGHDYLLFDKVLISARENGIDAKKIEIRPASTKQQAWLVSEVDRSYPTQVDSVAIDPDTLKVVDRVEFEKFPLMAKLTRWGIDIHMGSLFGLANQIILVLIAAGISLLALTGYWLWIKRNAWKKTSYNKRTLLRELRDQPRGNALVLLTLLTLIGICLPVLLISLVVFTLIEELIYI